MGARVAAIEAAQPVEEQQDRDAEFGEDHWVGYGTPGGYICSCIIGQDHEV